MDGHIGNATLQWYTVPSLKIILELDNELSVSGWGLNTCDHNSILLFNRSGKIMIDRDVRSQVIIVASEKYEEFIAIRSNAIAQHEEAKAVCEAMATFSAEEYVKDAEREGILSQSEVLLQVLKDMPGACPPNRREN